MKPQTAALGFRVKSGWAVAVMLNGSARSPRVCDVRRIDLSDPQLPETRQPYHAAMGKLETDPRKIDRRVRAVQSIAQRSIATLLARYRQNGHSIRRAALVVGSRIDPASVANPHIRAHALEGRLFRSVLEKSLRIHRIVTDLLIERDAYMQGAVQLEQLDENVRRTVRNFSRETEAPWRAEQKLAALAAWVALRG